MNGRNDLRIPWLPVLLLAAFFALGSVRSLARWILEIEWWKELGQSETYWQVLWYSIAPSAGAALLGFVALWIAHARALKSAGASLRRYPVYGRIVTLGLLVLAYLAASATVDNWTVVRFVGGSGLPPEAANSWSDPIFGKPLGFYFFALPFWKMVLRTALTFTILTGLVYLAAYLFWSIKERTPYLLETGAIELDQLDLAHLLHSRFLRIVVILFLAAFAAGRYLDRYDLLTNDHNFMVGIDYVDQNVRLPLRWLTIAACFAAMGLALLRRWVLAAAIVILPQLVEGVAPKLVHSVYVRPNEIALERPFIERHIAATRAAFDLDRRAREIDYKASLDKKVDFRRNATLFENVRLWDWRAFHDTISQIQALRPYYVFNDTDVDRYVLDGKLRQVMLTPRELDERQLSADARSRWMNPHFIYTHGYGLVMAEAARITADGLPELIIQNAPPELRTRSLQLTKPEIYFGEVTHEPVFVRTGQPEFNYPSGAENVHTTYSGSGGIPIGSFGMRLAATAAYADWNIILTGFLTPESRMLIRRNIRDRVEALADFLQWEGDPYLVVNKDGRLVWMIDGFTTSNSHPYARGVRLRRGTAVNYVRNSVKAAIDAYDGQVTLYLFDETDPIIQAYAKLFPRLFRPASEMPADLREHARYPESLFRMQAEIYRTFHMRDPEAFYNKEDAWDIARYLNSQDGRPEPLSPTYIVATLPGESEPEFLLLTPFTPRNKDNLIGLMVARCDGGKLGELLFLKLSKQELIFGPLQIEARINQDQIISKDLSLWNQQGSRVLRGQMLVLPVDDTFVYIVPIYIQASEARMPQLKKVVVATGNSMVYADTYEQALAELAGAPLLSSAAPQPPPPGEPAEANPKPALTSMPASGSDADRRLADVRRRMQRYRELATQGKWAEAGKELEALESLLR